MDKVNLKVKNSSVFEVLNLIEVPVAIVDFNFNILHYNKCFSKLKEETRTVFPSKEIESVLPGFLKQLAKVPSLGNSDEIRVLENFVHEPTKRIYDIKVSQTTQFLDYLDVISITCYDVTEKMLQLQPLIELGQQHIALLEQTQSGVITLKRHQEVLVELTKEDSFLNGEFKSALEILAKTTALTLGISRVNIWEFNGEFSELKYLVNYDADVQQFVEVPNFGIDRFPNYFKLLLSERIIFADDVYNDNRLVEFNEVFFDPQSIKSTFDIALSFGDNIWGLLCLENRFEQHKWSLEDQSFVRSIGDFVSSAYKTKLLKDTQVKLLDKANLYQTLVEQATDAILIIDKNNKFIDVNNALCEATGYTKSELLTMTFEDIIPERFKRTKSNMQSALRANERYFGERIFVTKDGKEKFAELSIRVFEDGSIQGIGRDITNRKIQEQALRESEVRLELALKGADLGVWDFYITENILVHNNNWGEMLGYYFESNVVNQEFWEKFIHPDDMATAIAAFEMHLAGITPYYETTIRMLHANGDWRWIQDRGKITEWDANGNPIRASGIHQDVTTIKNYQNELIRQRKFLQELINVSPNLVYVRNANKEFVTVSDSLAAFINTNREHIINYEVGQQESFSPILESLMQKDNEVFFTKKQVVVEEHLLVAPVTGKPVWFRSVKVPIFNEQGNISELLSVSMDISEIKLKEQQLNLLNESLELKVNERTASLEAANKELETFNHSVSHDLRTPLRSIDIFAYFLHKNYNHVLDNDGLENIRQIRNSIIKMGSLIDNLQIFSQIGRTEKTYSTLDTVQIIQEVISIYKDTQKLDNFKIVIGELPSLFGDYTMIKQVFMNLISNAIKFSSKRKKAVIEIYGYIKNNSATIAIKDNGVGFNMELKEKLFTALKRLHSDEQFDGTGIGLAIVERIIKRHNGSLWAESMEDKGSTFYFSLPIK